MPLSYDLNEIVNGTDSQTNFSTLLLKLIFKADRSNQEKLRKGFPNAVGMVEHYKTTGEIKDLRLRNR